MRLCGLLEGNGLGTTSERENLMWTGIKKWGSGKQPPPPPRGRGLRTSPIGREEYGMKKHERRGERKRGRKGRMARS